MSFQVRKEILWMGALLLLVGVSMSPPISAPLLWDDDNFIRFNPAVKELRNPISYFTDPGTLSQKPLYNRSIYRPIRTLGFALQYPLFGETGTGYRLFSLFLHVSCAIGLGALLYLVTQSWGLSVILSGLWALHPFHTEVVCFVSSQGDLESAASFLAATLLLLWTPTTSRTRVFRWLGYAFFMLLSVFSKETGVMGIFVQIGLLTFLSRPAKGMLATGLFISALYVLWRSNLLGRLTQTDTAVVAGMSDALIRIPKTYLAYLGSFLLPVHQNALYESVPWSFRVGGAALAAIAIVALWVRIRPHFVLAGALWFLFPLAPVVLIPISITFAERFSYLASMGLYLAAIPLARYFEGQRIRSVLKYSAVSALAIALTVLSFQRSALWGDEVGLFKDTVSKSPGLRVARRNLITALWERERDQEVLEETRRFLAKFPPEGRIISARADALCRLQYYSACIQTASLLLQDPDWADRGALNIIDAEQALGNKERARDLLSQFCVRNPSSPNCPPK